MESSRDTASEEKKITVKEIKKTIRTALKEKNIDPQQKESLKSMLAELKKLTPEQKKIFKKMLKLRAANNTEGLSLNTIRELLVIKGFGKAGVIEGFNNALKANLGWAALAFAVISLPISAYKLGRAIFDFNPDKVGRGIQITMAILGIGVGILAGVAATALTVVTAPILAAVGSSKATLENLVGIGKNLFDRFLSKAGRANRKQIKNLKKEIHALLGKKLSEDELKELAKKVKEFTRLTNFFNKLNEDLANKAHGLGVSLIALAGSIMLFFPPTTLAGLATLAGVSGYGVLATSLDLVNAGAAAKGKNIDLQVNPIKLVGKAIGSVGDAMKSTNEEKVLDKLLQEKFKEEPVELPSDEFFEKDKIIQNNVTQLKQIFQDERVQKQRDEQENLENFFKEVNRVLANMEKGGEEAIKEEEFLALLNATSTGEVVSSGLTLDSTTADLFKDLGVNREESKQAEINKAETNTQPNVSKMEKPEEIVSDIKLQKIQDKKEDKVQEPLKIRHNSH